MDINPFKFKSESEKNDCLNKMTHDGDMASKAVNNILHSSASEDFGKGLAKNLSMSVGDRFADSVKTLCMEKGKGRGEKKTIKEIAENFKNQEYALRQAGENPEFQTMCKKLLTPEK